MCIVSLMCSEELLLFLWHWCMVQMMQMPMSFMLTCIETNIRVTDMELCAFSGVTSTGFVAVGLGVIISSNGWVSTCPESGNTIIPHHHFGKSIAWNKWPPPSQKPCLVRIHRRGQGLKSTWRGADGGGTAGMFGWSAGELQGGFFSGFLSTGLPGSSTLSGCWAGWPV